MQFRTNAALSLGLFAITAGSALAGGTLTDGNEFMNLAGFAGHAVGDAGVVTVSPD